MEPVMLADRLNYTTPHADQVAGDEDDLLLVDWTEYIVATVGKSIALVYCIGIILVVMYYCYSIPRDEEENTGPGHCGRRGRRGRRGKDLPPSYNSIHFSDLPPHYEDVSCLDNLMGRVSPLASTDSLDETCGLV